MKIRVRTRAWGDLAESVEELELLSGTLTLNVSVHDGETARTQERTFDLIDVATIELSEHPETTVVDPGPQPIEAEWDVSAYRARPPGLTRAVSPSAIRLRARAAGRGGRAAAQPRCHGWRNSEVGTQVGTARAVPGSPAHLTHATMRIWLVARGRNGPGRSRTSAHGFEVRRSIR
jgi:hypothetical protein